MAEMKGWLFALIFFVAFILPGIFFFGIDSINQNAFLKTKAEVSELVKEEGGVTNRVVEISDLLRDKSHYAIAFKDDDGNSVTSTVEFGESVHINFIYRYKNVFGAKELNVTESVVIMKRGLLASGEPTPDPIKPVEPDPVVPETKTIQFASEEKVESNIVQVFTIPNLKNVKSITTNTGSANILSVVGDKVAVSMKNGDSSGQIQSGGEFISPTVKYVTNENSSNYDKDGYKGRLSSYLFSGELLTKEVVDFPVTFGKKVTQNQHGFSNQAIHNFSCYGDNNTLTFHGNGHSGFSYMDSEGYNKMLGLSSVEVRNTKFFLDLKEQHTPCITSEVEKIPITKITGTYLLSGTAEKDTRIYRYQGDVTKPGIDTRTYVDAFQYQLTIEYEEN